MAKKMVTFTFKNGVTVNGVSVAGVIYPFEYQSQLIAEKFCNNFFNDGIYTTVIESYTKPNKYYLQIINTNINDNSSYSNNVIKDEFLTTNQIVKRGLSNLTVRSINLLCKELQSSHPEHILGGGQGNKYKIHSSILNLFEGKYNKKVTKNEFTKE